MLRAVKSGAEPTTQILVGCAGWNIPRTSADEFPESGTHLARYARQLNAVEINSSFYRPHRIGTYQRWADSTPAGFRFAVKIPKQITHVQRLIEVDGLIEQFLSETQGLGEKLGAILVQLPPSLTFESPVAEAAFAALRARTIVPIVCEPRHPSWFAPDAESMMRAFLVDRVAADPAVVTAAAEPGGCLRELYFRWHGTPRIYWSAYDPERLEALAGRVQRATAEVNRVWCIFDNTAAGAAQKNALELRRILQGDGVPAARDE
jgi:uncharacterized protein YecE (DUF72 family)